LEILLDDLKLQRDSYRDRVDEGVQGALVMVSTIGASYLHTQGVLDRMKSRKAMLEGCLESAQSSKSELSSTALALGDVPMVVEGADD